MPNRTPPGREGETVLSRRRVLTGVVFAGTGVTLAHTLTNSTAFTEGSTGRDSTISVSNDGQGVLGLFVADRVQRNQQSVLTEITNNSGGPVSVTVSLDVCDHGVLHRSTGDSGCELTFSLQPSESRRVEIESGEADGTQVPFTIAGSSEDGFSFSLPRGTMVETGRVQSSVSIDRITQFRKRPADGEWVVRRLSASSDTHELDRIEIRIRNIATDSIVSTTTIDSIEGMEYDARGRGNEPALRFTPDDPSYDIRQNQEYELTATVYDTEGNFDTDSATN